jgi:hypothetical protein
MTKKEASQMADPRKENKKKPKKGDLGSCSKMGA